MRVRVGMLAVLTLGSAEAQAPAVSPFQKGPVPFALLRESWIEDVEAGRIFSVVSRYVPDAEVLNADGTHADGVKAVQSMFNAEFARYAVTLRLTSRVTSESGELAYDSGSYAEELSDRTSKVVIQVRGDYLTIYRRNGLQWSIVQQAFTEGAR